MKQTYKFPKNFLWGASSSAYQCEGAFDEDGKGLSVQDVKKVFENTSDFTICSEHYHRYKEDIALLAEMNAKAYRFSIAWTRILPDGEHEVNEKGIAHYHDVIDTCLAYNIVPIVTMYHFDLPYELEKSGGWSNRKTIDAFEKYSSLLFKEYGNKVPYFLTINEQNVMILGGSVIGTSLSKENHLQNLYQQNHHMMLAQAKAIILCHTLAPKAKIGPAPNINSVYAKSCSPNDYLAKLDAAAIRNWMYLDLAVYGRYNFQAWNYLAENNSLPIIEDGDMDFLQQAKPDFISLNYYATATVEAWKQAGKCGKKADQQNGLSIEKMFSGTSNPYLNKTPFGWEIDPIGFQIVLREVYDRYHLPILISENGMGTYDTLEEDGTIHDSQRIEYYQAHIKEMAKAMHNGVEVLGYCPWSAMDLISTHEGFRKRYGFIYVNRTDEDVLDLKRYKKDSFYWYQKMISKQGMY